MSEKKLAREEGTSTRSNEVIDALSDNTVRIVDEVAKAQSQFAQSTANLQLDSIHTVKDTIQTAFTNQKQVYSTLNLAQFPQASEQVVKQTTEITNNVIRSIGIFNQLGINALDAARENVKIYNSTVDAVTDFNNNLLKAWTSYWSAQQQQFNRA
jgi:hypothetical protein